MIALTLRDTLLRLPLRVELLGLYMLYGGLFKGLTRPIASKLVHFEGGNHRDGRIGVVQRRSGLALGPALIIRLMVEHRVAQPLRRLKSSLILLRLLLLSPGGCSFLVVVVRLR